MMYRTFVVLLLATAALGGPLGDLDTPITALSVKMMKKLSEIKNELDDLASRVSMNEEDLTKQTSDRELKDEQIHEKIEALQQSLAEQTETVTSTINEKMVELMNGITGKLMQIKRDIVGNTKKIKSLEEAEYEEPSGPDTDGLRAELRAEMNAKIQQIAQMIASLKLQMGDEGSDRKAERPGFTCDIKSDDKCFMIVLAQLNVDQANFMCNRMGSKLANIYSKSQYDKIMKKTRDMVTYHTQMYTGMTFDLSTKKPLLRDGSRAPYTRWHRWFPSSTGIWIGFAVDPKNPTSEHMTNFTPPHTANGCVCEAPAK